MNIIFFIILISGTILMLIFNPSEFISTLINASTKTVDLSIKLIAIYAIWMSILEILERTGLSNKLSKLLKPIIKKLFGKINKEAEEQISINISSNILGMGNASTPSGIKAMELLDDKSGKINSKMIMFMILNTCTLQLIPTTIIGLRISAGSKSASSIIIPTIIVSIISTAIGIFSVLIISKIKEHRNKKRGEK